MHYIKTALLLVITLLSLFGCGDNNGFVIVPGPKGSQGEAGPTGPQGPAGTAAQPCTVVQTATGASISCPDGTTAHLTNGFDTSNGLTVSVVQFCPGYVPAYPSVFPEVGLCINGALYAVYSANDGFLTEIVSGTYNSNAVGSSCTFTVTGCTVTQ